MSGKKDKFVSIMESEGDFQDKLIAFVYEKSEKKWFLENFRIGNVHIAGKSTIDYFDEAKDMSDKGHYVPAIIRLSVANGLLRPAPFVQYEKEKEIKELINKCNSKINEHQFPMLLDLETKPSIYAISPQFVKNDLYPLIKYVTKISFQNEEELNSEVDSMLPVIEGLFPGISRYGDYVIFRTFDEPPTSKKEYKVFGVAKKVSKN